MPPVRTRPVRKASRRKTVVRRKPEAAVVSRARAEAERALDEARRAHARLREAIDILPQGIVFLDADGRFILWNRQYAEIYQRSADLFKPGARLADALRTSVARGDYPDAVGREEEWLAERLALQSSPGTRHEQRLADGRHILIEERRTSDGGIIGLRIDITDLKRREESFRLLFDSNPLPMWVYDAETLRFLAVNDAAVQHYGYGRDEFLTMSILDIRPLEDHDEVRRSVATRHAADGVATQTRRHRKKDGGLIEVAIRAKVLQYEGRAAALVAVMDMTDRKRAEDEVRRTREFLDNVIAHAPAAIAVRDVRDGRYVLANRAAEHNAGVPHGAMVGKTVHEVFPKETADLMARRDAEALESRKPTFFEEHTVETPGRGTRIVTSTRILLPDERGGPGYLLSLVDDVTERRRAEDRIAHLAYHDTLTDLPNRAAFNQQLAAAVERASAAPGSFAILSLDLDRFKEINDLFSHPAGDALLREIAARLKRIAEGAFVARIGGDEFMLITPVGAQPTTAETVAERIQDALAQDFEIDGQRLRTGVTIGVAIFPSDANDAESLVSNADTALCRAKAEGRGSVCFFEAAMDEQLRDRRMLQHDLKTAIGHRDLALHYQPQARIDGSVVGFEALARWSHPTRGMISPRIFVPLAEDSGLIMPMGEWILREACREAASWPRPLQVAVNVSPVQFRQGDLPGLVQSILLETGLAPRRLEIEITEGVLIGDFSRAASILRRLKAIGVRVAMDDFGTGYSSLSYLQAFPFDKIKIDQTFIARLTRHHPSAKIVRAVINLGQQLDIPVLAEGVETPEQLAFLKGEACSEIQGFLLGRPAPIEQYAALVGRVEAPRARHAAES